jgi:hypothetical protein
MSARFIVPGASEKIIFYFLEESCGVRLSAGIPIKKLSIKHHCKKSVPSHA